jgi:hypothetical protein
VFAGAVTTAGVTPERLALHAITPPGTALAAALRAGAANLHDAVAAAFP